MAVKVMEMKNTDLDRKTYKVSLFADTKTEMSNSPKIIGLPVGATIEMGSSVLTAAGELAFMKSNGTWSWV